MIWCERAGKTLGKRPVRPRFSSVPGFRHTLRRGSWQAYDGTVVDRLDARYYNNNFGRFWSPDPAGISAVDYKNPTSWNGYIYVWADPINAADPSGRCVIAGVTYPDGQPPCPDVTSVNVVGFGNSTAYGPWNGMDGYESAFHAIQETSGPGGGAFARLQGFLTETQQLTCSGLPDGMLLSVSAGAALGIGASGSAELVFNFNTGQISGFLSGGPTASGFSTPSAAVQAGFIWGLGNSNSNYSGPFSTLSFGAGIISGQLATTSLGLTNPFQMTAPTSASVGVQTPGASFSYGVAYYTNPLNLGNLNSIVGSALFPDEAAYMQVYQQVKSKLCGGGGN